MPTWAGHASQWSGTDTDRGDWRRRQSISHLVLCGKVLG